MIPCLAIVVYIGKACINQYSTKYSCSRMPQIAAKRIESTTASFRFSGINYKQQKAKRKNFYKITLQKYWKFLFNCCNMIAEKYLHKQKYIIEP